MDVVRCETLHFVVDGLQLGQQLPQTKGTQGIAAREKRDVQGHGVALESVSWPTPLTGAPIREIPILRQPPSLRGPEGGAANPRRRKDRSALLAVTVAGRDPEIIVG